MQRNERRAALLLALLCSVLALSIATTSSPLYAANFWTDTNLYFTIGRGMTEGLMPYLTMNDGPIHDALRYYSQTYDTDLTPAGFGISGSAPKLSTADFDPDAPCQTVTITKGQPDYHLDQDAVYALVMEAYDNAIAMADAYVVEFRYEATALPEEFDRYQLIATDAGYDDRDRINKMLYLYRRK